jgi:hypothetical protein
MVLQLILIFSLPLLGPELGSSSVPPVRSWGKLNGHCLYQVALKEVRKAIGGAPLRMRPPVGGHIGPPLQKKKICYLYERNLVLEGIIW